MTTLDTTNITNQARLGLFFAYLSGQRSRDKATKISPYYEVAVLGRDGKKFDATPYLDTAWYAGANGQAFPFPIEEADIPEDLRHYRDLLAKRAEQTATTGTEV